jgi:hypothetical protein
LRSGRGLERRLNYYATRGLFVIDEIGYLSYDARAADLLYFQVVSWWLERRSLRQEPLSLSPWPHCSLVSTGEPSYYRGRCADRGIGLVQLFSQLPTGYRLLNRSKINSHPAKDEIKKPGSLLSVRPA